MKSNRLRVEKNIPYDDPRICLDSSERMVGIGMSANKVSVRAVKREKKAEL